MNEHHHPTGSRRRIRGMTRSQVEGLLEAALGRPRRSARDIHTELVLVDRQRAVLNRVLSSGPACLFTVEEVELLFDALEEFGDCYISDVLGIDWLAADAAPPPLTTDEVRALIELCAFQTATVSRAFIEGVDAGLVVEQTRLRKALVSWQEPVEGALRPAPLAAGRPAERPG